MESMNTVRFIYWEEKGFWVGHFEEYPDYLTQGESFEDLQEHLRDLYKDLTEAGLPNIRRRGELQIA
jgi:predicted RNase H-like HicB family nuclease